MRSRSLGVFGPLWVAIAFFACARAPQKFKLDFPHKDNQLILTLRAGESIRVEDLSASFQGSRVEVINDRSFLVQFPERNDVDLEKTAERYLQDSRIQAVEANVIYKLDDVIPNDPDFAKLYGLRNDGAQSGVIGADIGVTKAWDVSTGSSNVLIGIIDSGADYNHPDLIDNMWSNPGETGLDANGVDKRSNGIDDDGNGFVDDWHGWDFYNGDNNPMDDNSHGSHVAGTIGGRGNNGRGVVGVNWTVSMVPVKVFSAAGESTSDVLIKGIDYATSLGVVATNNSWGGGAFSDAMLAAIQRAEAKDILFIAAAGNDGSSNDGTAHYPSTYDVSNIISVAATDRKDNLASFSNFGLRSVQVAAPGTDIWSTTPNNSYGLKSGTSMATPHVTGLVALIKSAYPTLSGQEIKDKIIAGATLVPQLQSTVKYGRINAASALENDVVAPSAVEDITILDVGIKDVSVSWKESGDDGTIGSASRYLVKLSSQPIADEDQWKAATPVTLIDSLRSQGRVKGRITGLQYNQQSYLAVRALDNVGNLSDLSDSPSFTLKPVQVLVTEENTSLEGWKRLDTPWGLVNKDGISFLSDSPSGSYQNNQEIIAETVDYSIADSDLILDLKTRYQLEANYDFGYIELSRDLGQTWVQLAKLSGNSPWTTLSISLQEYLQGASVFRIRLRLKTDYSITYEGWDIDSFQVVGRQL